MVFSNNLLLGAGGQSTGPDPFDPTLIGNSVWLDGTADYLSRTPSAGTTTRWIWSSWVQRTEFGNAANAHTIFSAGNALSNLSWIRFDDQDHFDFAIYQGSTTARKTSTAKYRDMGWYHLCVSFDSGSSIAPDSRIQLFVNGIEVAELSSSTATPSGETTAFNDNVIQEIGRYSYNGSQYGHAYLAQFTMLENKSFQNGDLSITDLLDSFTYGTNGSQFSPKADADIAALASSAGGNSFCLDFSNSGSLGLDSSTPANNFTPTDMSSTNQSTNTPSLAYPKISNIGTPSGDAAANYTMGLGSNRMVYSGANQTYKGLLSTQLIQPDDSPIYWEYYLESGSVGGASGGRVSVGLCVPHFNVGNGNGFAGAGGSNPSILLGVIHDNGSQGSTTGDTVVPVGGIQNLAYEPSTGKIWFGVNGTWNNGSEAASTTLNPSGHDYQATVQDYVFFISAARSTDIGVTNFGDNPTMSGNITAGGNADENGYGNFKYAVPSGFLAPNSANLTSPDYQGIDYFTPTLYQGNGEGQRVGDFVPFTDSITIANSIIFNDNDTAYLNRTFVTPTSANKFTFAFWMKCGSSTSDQYIFSSGTSNGTEAYMALNHSTGGGQLWIADPNDGVGWGVKTDRKILDSSSWTHICLSVDSTADSGSRFAIEINGVTATTTAFGAAEPSASQSLNFITATAKNIGRRIRTSSAYFDGYLSDVYFIDGEKLAASNFAQLDTSTNRWVPKAYSGSYGNNGFKLAFGTAPGTGSGAGTDTSGEGHNWTENNFGTNDQVIDTPTKNFATLEPTYGYSNTTYTQGNLAVVGANVASQQNKTSYSTAFSQKSGKWWVEFDSILDAGGTTVFYGIIPTQYIRDGSFVAAAKDASTGYADNLKGSIRAYIVGSTYGNKVYNISIGTGSGTTDLTSGGIINNNAGGYTDLVPYGIALDMDNKKMWIGNPTISATTWNNETSVSPAANTGGFDLEFDEYSIFISNSLGTSFINFGQYVGSWNGNSVTDHTSTAGGNFTLAPPTDFKAINQDNLDDTASKLTALAWIKNRDATDNHMLANRVRGPQFINNSNSNSTGETTNVNAIQRFLQRGVQVGSDAEVNTANEAYVLWQWLLGDSATTGSTTSPAGSIASTTIVADADHMSIGTFTGTGSNGTVGHGLSAAPEAFVVFNPTVAARFKMFYHKYSNASPASGYIHLESTEAFQTDSTIYNNTVPTATVFSVGTNASINENTKLNTFIAWRSVAGVCKVGSYIGNSSDDGPYLSLGFKPSYWMVKETTVSDASHDWFVSDSARYTFNGTTTAGGLNGGTLEANDTTAEEAHSTNFGDNPAFDFLADGIKLRTNSGTINATGRTYIYLAMADIGGNGTLPPVYGR